MSKIGKFIERRVRCELAAQGEKITVGLKRNFDKTEFVTITLDDLGVTAKCVIQVDKGAQFSAALTRTIPQAARTALEILQSAVRRKAAEIKTEVSEII
jgi:hypothetical protein